jgi:hypothetical protein
MKRGIKRRPAVAGCVRLDGVTHEGAVAFEVSVSASVYHERVLQYFERLLDAIDPPRLHVVEGAVDQAAAAPPPRSGVSLVLA